MEKPSSWGDHLVVVAISHLLMRPIHIVTDSTLESSAVTIVEPPSVVAETSWSSGERKRRCLKLKPLLWHPLDQRNIGAQPSDDPVPWRVAGVPVVKLWPLPAGGTVRFRATKRTLPNAPNDAAHIGVADGGEEVQLRPGTYAAVKVQGGSFYMALFTDPAQYGDAGGHPALAFEGPVVFAGEVKLDHTMCVTAWDLKSGTFAIPRRHRGQSELPDHLYWQFIENFDPGSVGADVLLACVKGGAALVRPKEVAM